MPTYTPNRNLPKPVGTDNDTRANFNTLIDAIDPKWRGALPALFLYDRQGRRTASFIGETPAEEIQAAVRKLL